MAHKALLAEGKILPGAGLRQRVPALDAGYSEERGTIYVSREAVAEYPAHHLAHPILNELYHWRSEGETEDADHDALAQAMAVLRARWEAATGRRWEER